MSALELSVVPGRTPLVLVAPHGGRRDARAHPWGSRPLKMNDLHTASLTRELAERCGAAALVNASLDRNLTDLNRISAAHERARAFLHHLHELVAAARARHGFAAVVIVHGWNVVQPAVDIGLGCRPGESAPLGPGAAVSPEFAHTAVATLCNELRARGIAASLGARYPARARENLVQLFSGRHRDDPRPLVRRLAALGPGTEALQLELGAPLRWPGAWRSRFVDACAAALPEFVARAMPSAGRLPTCGPAARAGPSRRIEIVGKGYQPDGVGRDDFGLLAAFDPGGGRLLVFPPDGTLLMFGSDRLGSGRASDTRDRVGGLVLEDGSAPELRYRGPLLRFPSTTPFLDLERGLASAAMVDDAEVRLIVHPDAEERSGQGRFGVAGGTLRIAGCDHTLAGQAYVARQDANPPWPRLRAALRLPRDERLVMTLDLARGSAEGTLLSGGSTVAVRAATARLDEGDAPLDRWALEVGLADGSSRRVALEAVHRLPVIRGASGPPVRVLYASCRIAGAPALDPAGWVELAGA